MIRVFRRNAGFTIIELSLVLIVMGILAAVLMPMAQTAHESSMNERDQTTLKRAKDGLMGYIRINMGIPCVDATGDVSTGCDPTTTLTRLGVRTNDARNQTFAYDVNERLTERWLDDNTSDICTQLGYMVDPTTIPPAPVVPPPVEPQVCDAANANTGNTACTPTTTPSYPYSSTMAFLMVGRGSDRCLNLENTHASAINDGVCPTAVINNRTFENPARLHSRTVDDGYYEDLIYTITPTELAEAMDCPIGGGSGGGFSYCLSGEKLVQVINGVNGSMGISIDGLCYTVDRGTTAGLGCQTDATSIGVYSTNNCSGLLFSGTAASLDTNTDGRTDIVCDRTGACTSR